MPFPGEDGQIKIGHAELQIGDSRLFLADEFPAYGSLGPSGGSPVTIHLYVTDADRSVYSRRGERVRRQSCRWPTCLGRPLRQTHRSVRPQLVDPEHLEDLTPEQMQERMAAAMSKQPCD